MSKKRKQPPKRGQVVEVDKIRGLVLKDSPDAVTKVTGVVFKNKTVAFSRRATQNTAWRRSAIKGFMAGDTLIHAGQIQQIRLAGESIDYSAVRCFAMGRLPGGGTTPPRPPKP
jgi:hypothetical protein